MHTYTRDEPEPTPVEVQGGERPAGGLLPMLASKLSRSASCECATGCWSFVNQTATRSKSTTAALENGGAGRPKRPSRDRSRPPLTKVPSQDLEVSSCQDVKEAAHCSSSKSREKADDDSDQQPKPVLGADDIQLGRPCAEGSPTGETMPPDEASPNGLDESFLELPGLATEEEEAAAAEGERMHHLKNAEDTENNNSTNHREENLDVPVARPPIELPEEALASGSSLKKRMAAAEAPSAAVAGAEASEATPAPSVGATPLRRSRGKDRAEHEDSEEGEEEELAQRLPHLEFDTFLEADPAEAAEDAEAAAFAAVAEAEALDLAAAARSMESDLTTGHGGAVASTASPSAHPSEGEAATLVVVVPIPTGAPLQENSDAAKAQEWWLRTLREQAEANSQSDQKGQNGQGDAADAERMGQVLSKEALSDTARARLRSAMLHQEPEQSSTGLGDGELDDPLDSDAQRASCWQSCVRKAPQDTSGHHGPTLEEHTSLEQVQVHPESSFPYCWCKR